MVFYSKEGIARSLFGLARIINTHEGSRRDDLVLELDFLGSNVGHSAYIYGSSDVDRFLESLTIPKKGEADGRYVFVYQTSEGLIVGVPNDDMIFSSEKDPDHLEVAINSLRDQPVLFSLPGSDDTYNGLLFEVRQNSISGNSILIAEVQGSTLLKYHAQCGPHPENPESKGLVLGLFGNTPIFSFGTISGGGSTEADIDHAGIIAAYNQAFKKE